MKADIERYARLDSPLHRWDARWKLVSLIVLIFAWAVVSQPWIALACLFFSISVLFTGRLPLHFIFKRLGAVHLFLIPCFIVLPFTVPGQPIDVMGLTINQEGLKLATTLYLRAAAIVILSMALIYSTPMTRLLRAAEKLRVPRVLIQIALLTYRYIFTLSWEASRIRWALATRGFHNRAVLRVYQTWANVIGLTLIRSLERTERIYRAMQCRGYDGTMKTLCGFSTTSMDVVKSSVCVVSAILVLVCDYGM